MQIVKIWLRRGIAAVDEAAEHRRDQRAGHGEKAEAADDVAVIVERRAAQVEGQRRPDEENAPKTRLPFKAMRRSTGKRFTCLKVERNKLR